jgi:hypothetical protein
MAIPINLPAAEGTHGVLTVRKLAEYRDQLKDELVRAPWEHRCERHVDTTPRGATARQAVEMSRVAEYALPVGGRDERGARRER